MQWVRSAVHVMARPSGRRAAPLLPVWLIIVVIAVTVAGSAAAGSFAFSTARSLWGRLDGSAQGASIWPPPAPTLASGGTPAPGTSGAGVTNWQCGTYTRTVTVLVLGIDQRRETVEPEYYHTDTMILLTLDPLNRRAVMLSIPRDLWVTIPDFGLGRTNNRINTANLFGDAYGYPGGGPALAVRTVQLNLGIPVDYYARLNFTAFEDFVDRIGGIDIVVPEDIYDPEYPTWDDRVELFEISAGPHHLDGPTALKYARTRYTLGSDFDRAKRQQQVILAVRDRITQTERLPQLLASAPELYDIFKDSVQTNLTLNEAACLALLAEEVPGENIRSATIDERYTQSWTTPEGWEVLVPDRAGIAELMVTLYGK